MKTHEELTIVSADDMRFYNDVVYGLPKRSGNNGDFYDKNGFQIPFGSEAHIVKHFREVAEIVKPNMILEIGLNLGYSAALWLNLTQAKVFSIDISDRDETIQAGAMLSNWYGDRFQFLIWDSADTFKFLKHKDFKLAFVDGGHDFDSVTNDIELILKLQIEYVLFDDIYERYGPGVLQAIEQFPELELVKDMDNLRLYRNNSFDI